MLSGNRLLEALPDAEQAALLPHLTRVQIAVHELLYEADQPIPHVWFPLHGAISMITLLYEGATVEVAVVGNEGMVGLPVFLGVHTDVHQAQGQLPGEALRMDAAALRTAAAGLPALQALLLRYVQVLLIQTSQGAACNARHEVTERCARWLLEAHDRVRRDRFPLTQDFLAGMLGVRRASVTVAAGILQQAGFIRAMTAEASGRRERDRRSVPPELKPGRVNGNPHRAGGRRHSRLRRRPLKLMANDPGPTNRRGCPGAR